MTSPTEPTDDLTLTDPLMPHLVELVARPEARNAVLIGGFGLRLRQAYLRHIQARTLISDVPSARATQDLDMFLHLEIWQPPQEQAHHLRVALGELGYETHVASFQFRKPLAGTLPDATPLRIKLDLLARTPEDESVKVRRPKGGEKSVSEQVPQVGRGMGVDLTGYETPEGFAVEDSPQSISVAHGNTRASVRLPHPYAWLNLKVKAAHDWLLEERGDLPAKPGARADARLKHPFDVYLLTASLQETEIEEAATLAEKYRDHLGATEIRDMARELFAASDGPGLRAAQRYARASGMGSLNLDHALFFDEGLRPALGL